MSVKDRNEFGKIKHEEGNKKEKTRVRLGHLVLEFCTDGSLTDENIDLLFDGIRAVDVVTIKGLMTDVTKAVKYVSDKMKSHNVDCGRLDVSVML